MRQEDIEKILDIGLALTSEKDFDVLLELILKKVMDLTHCDGGTLYLLNKENDALEFHVMCTHSMNTYQGSKENPCTLPPVKLTRGSVSALAVLDDKTIIIDDAYHCEEYDLSGPKRYDGMTGYHTQSILVVPMKDRFDRTTGVLQLINAQDVDGTVIPFAPEYVRMVESVASQAAVTIENMRYLEDIRELFQSLVHVLSAAVDERTPYNANHTRHMAEYGDYFINYLNEQHAAESGTELFNPEVKRELLMSVWFHDIGKLITPLEVMNKMARLCPDEDTAIRNRFEVMKLKLRISSLEGKTTAEQASEISAEIDEAQALVDRVNTAGFLPDELLESLAALKEKKYTDYSSPEMTETPWITDLEYSKLTIRKGTLTDEERKIMEEHVVITDKLLSKIKFSPDLSHVREWAGSHHELLNGRGYPRKLSGDQIPTEVRVITILDIFDALVASDRPYKKGMPVEKALGILDIMANKEGSLDPVLTKMFIDSKCWEPVQQAEAEGKL